MPPSAVLRIEDEYTAFCFDEACSRIMAELDKKDAKAPRWVTNEESDDLISFLETFQ